MPLDPAARTLRARIGAFAMHSKHPVEKTTRGGLDAAWQRFVLQVDPDGLLPEAERTRRAKAAQQAHMARLALRSVQARQGAKPPGDAA
jgi:hypothetical protein